jgi:hypothetical protein
VLIIAIILSFILAVYFFRIVSFRIVSHWQLELLNAIPMSQQGELQLRKLIAYLKRSRAATLLWLLYTESFLILGLVTGFLLKVMLLRLYSFLPPPGVTWFVVFAVVFLEVLEFLKLSSRRIYKRIHRRSIEVHYSKSNWYLLGLMGICLFFIDFSAGWGTMLLFPIHIQSHQGLYYTFGGI